MDKLQFGAIDLSNITGIILVFMPITDKIRKFLDVTPRDSRDVIIYLKWQSTVTEKQY